MSHKEELFSNRKALVLAGGVPQRELIKKLKERGYYVILADYTERPVASDVADVFFRESTLDVPAIRAIAVNECVDLIITCCTDQALATVSLLSEELGLPCYVGSQTGLAVTNKAAMKKKFVAGGIPTAAFMTVHSFADAKEFLEKKAPPFVVKPADCNSSKGVVSIEKQEECADVIKAAVSMSRTETAVIECYVNGIELSVDCFIQDGKTHILCISKSEKIEGGNGFIICRGIYNPELHERYLDKMQHIASRIAEAFGLDNCPMLIQVIASGDELSVVEFSARTGGCIKYRMIELASGFDIIDATINATLGVKQPIKLTMADEVIVNEFVYCRPGTFHELVNFEKGKDEGLIENYFLLKSSGTVFEGVSSSGDRVAAVTITARSLAHYREKLNKLAQIVDVVDRDGKSMIRRDLLLRGSLVGGLTP